MLSAEGIGKNIEQAIENALFELKAVREDVDIKILSEGGLFKKAKVLVTISEDAREKYEKKVPLKQGVKRFLEFLKQNHIPQEPAHQSLQRPHIPHLQTIPADRLYGSS